LLSQITQNEKLSAKTTTAASRSKNAVVTNSHMQQFVSQRCFFLLLLPHFTIDKEFVRGNLYRDFPDYANE
jgi:hypothetical protein